MKYKMSYLSIIISGIFLVGCGNGGESGGGSKPNPTPTPNPSPSPDLPNNPAPILPNTPMNIASTHPINDEPLSALSLDNIITQKPLQLVENGNYDINYEFNQYSNNNDKIELLSKNYLTDSELQNLTKHIVWSEGTQLRSVYAYNQKALTSEHGEGIIKAVEPSLGRIAPYFYTDAREALNHMIDVQPSFNCLVAIDYSNKKNYGENLNVISNDIYNELESLLIEQGADLNGNEYIYYPFDAAINQAIRKVTNNNINQKITMLDNAYSYYKSNSNVIYDNYNDDFVKYACHDAYATEKYLSSLVEVKESVNSIGNKIEVKYSNSDGLNSANILNIELHNFSGSNWNNENYNKLTHDIIDNIMYKHLFLNKIFGYNGDEDAYISINSFKNGEFIGLYEGLASYHADQYFNSKTNFTCNAAALTGCSYLSDGKNYGSYGLMAAYLLSGYNSSKQAEQKAALSSFIDNLKNNAALGCGVSWDSVSYNQVLMSNICIADAFDNAGFKKLNGGVLTWAELKSNWNTIMNEYKNDLYYVSEKYPNSIL